MSNWKAWGALIIGIVALHLHIVYLLRLFWGLSLKHLNRYIDFLVKTPKISIPVFLGMACAIFGVIIGFISLRKTGGDS